MQGDKPLLGAISHIRLFAMPDDWERTVRFYRDMLGFSERYVDAEAGIAGFECGDGPEIGIERVDPAEVEEIEMAGRFAGVSFRVADIETAVRGLSEQGVVFDGSPQRMDWGGTLAHFRDPAGNVLTLTQYPGA